MNFDWSASPPDPSFGRDYPVRWTGQVKPLYSESYTFITITDDGVRLWVNGQMLINDWHDTAPTTNSGTIALTAGQKYVVEMDYFETGGPPAIARLFWQSTSQSQQIVPQSQLYPA